MFLLVLVALHPLHMVHAVHADGAGDCVKNTGASTGAMLLQRHSDVSKASSEASAVEALAEAERKYKRLVENMENMMAEVWKPVPRRSMLQVDDSEEGEEVSQHEASQGAARRRRRSRRRNIDWTSTAACHLMMFEGEDWDESSGWRAEAVANNECQAMVEYLDDASSSGSFYASAGCKLTAYDASGCSGTSLVLVDGSSKSKATVRLINPFGDILGSSWNNQISSLKCTC